MAMPGAGDAPGRIAVTYSRPLIPIPAQGGGELGFKKLFDEAANARAHPSFQGIEPIIAKKMLAFRRADRRLCAICCHGVISVGALTPILVCFHKLEITPPSNSNHSRDGTSADIRINYGDPVTGQSGRLFLPFDARIGRKLTDNLALSLEVGVPIIKDYPVYNFKTEVRVNLKVLSAGASPRVFQRVHQIGEKIRVGIGIDAQQEAGNFDFHRRSG